MKKIIILLFFFIGTTLIDLAQGLHFPCTWPNGCPPNMFQMSTSYITLKVSENPELYCRVRICYCFACYVTQPNNDSWFYFNIAEIQYADKGCLNRSNINWNVFKKSIVKELVLQNPGCFVFDCDDPLHPPFDKVELITAQCYMNYWCYVDGQVGNGYGMMLRCGDGYCGQKYHVCYNNGELQVTTRGAPYIFGNCEGEPTFPLGCVSGEILDQCYSICY